MRNYILIAVMLFGCLAHAEDSVPIIEVKGAPPVKSPDGKAIAPARKVVRTIKDKQFEAIRKNVEEIVAILDKKTTWWDIGPDASYISAEISLGGK